MQNSNGLDLDFVRSQFPGLKNGWTFFDNAGGSQILAPVVERIRDYLFNKKRANRWQLCGFTGSCAVFVQRTRSHDALVKRQAPRKKLPLPLPQPLHCKTWPAA